MDGLNASALESAAARATWPERRWKVFLIHHAHTDVGYTAPQARVGRLHADYMRRVLRLLREDPDARFRWTSETFWAVERFLEIAAPGEREELAEHLRAGRIGFSHTYLHFNELASAELVSAGLGRAAAFRDRHALPCETAFSADINGFGWGYAAALRRHGVRNLLTCVHSHHGMYPLQARHTPFYWTPPDGGAPVLVWSAEHYWLGNELGLCPGAVFNYVIQDEFSPPPALADTRALATVRLTRFLRQLETDGYPYAFVPVMVSGLILDNTPPNPAIAAFADAWNARHGDRVELEMTTPDAFFRHLREQPDAIPTHAGDWPDWWSDGSASTPMAVRQFRRAQRLWRQLDAREKRSPGSVDGEPLKAVESDLLHFAEHTWNDSEALNQPWLDVVHQIGGRNKAYAVCALERAEALREALFPDNGVLIEPGRPWRYRAWNAASERYVGPVSLFIEGFEDDGGLFERVAVVDERDGARLSCQLEPVPRGVSLIVWLALEPGEERFIRLETAEASAPASARRDDPRGSDGVLDVTRAEDAGAWEHGLCTPHVLLEWGEGGIGRWHDFGSGADLLDPSRAHAPFTLVHEITPVDDRGVDGARKAMGRNRKGLAVRRSRATPTGVRALEAGPVFARAELSYEVAGAEAASVRLTAYYAAPRVDVEVRLHKQLARAPENVYLALPFAGLDDDATRLWLDKSGAAIRPWVDQLPGTLTDYYAVQGGFALCGERFGLAVAMPDQHLLQLGPLEHRDRLLAGDERLGDLRPAPYAWLMTNFWETNFDASLAGFHEFRYAIAWGEAMAAPQAALAWCRTAFDAVDAHRLRESR